MATNNQISDFPPPDQTRQIIGMLAVNAAWNATNKCKVCNQTGVTPERYLCACRVNLPYPAERINQIVYGQ